jgi:hypothetical protein
MAKRRPKHYPPRFRVFGISAEAWTRKYGVVPYTRPCVDCGALRTTSLPFVQGGAHGLMAPTCACGNSDDAPYVVLLDDFAKMGGAPAAQKLPSRRGRPTARRSLVTLSLVPKGT